MGHLESLPANRQRLIKRAWKLKAKAERLKKKYGNDLRGDLAVPESASKSRTKSTSKKHVDPNAEAGEADRLQQAQHLLDSLMAMPPSFLRDLGFVQLVDILVSVPGAEADDRALGFVQTRIMEPGAVKNINDFLDIIHEYRPLWNCERIDNPDGQAEGNFTWLAKDESGKVQGIAYPHYLPGPKGELSVFLEAPDELYEERKKKVLDIFASADMCGMALRNTQLAEAAGLSPYITKQVAIRMENEGILENYPGEPRNVLFWTMLNCRCEECKDRERWEEIKWQADCAKVQARQASAIQG
jgi:hypothetical protein